MKTEARKQLVWRIVRSTANDNRTSAAFWLKYFLPWSMVIGLLLGWVLFP